MSTEDNKALVRRFYGESVHNPALLDELLAPTYVLHLPGSPPIAGIEGAKQLMVAYTSAFPDLQLTTEDLVAEGDKVAIRNTWRGTHQGAFQGLLPNWEARDVYRHRYLSLRRWQDRRTVGRPRCSGLDATAWGYSCHGIAGCMTVVSLGESLTDQLESLALARKQIVELILHGILNAPTEGSET